MKKLIDLTSDKYGNFTIEESKKNQVVIWWDFYDEQDGLMMSPDIKMFEDCDISDFSDLPKNGIFKSINDAKIYLKNKFGKLK